MRLPEKLSAIMNGHVDFSEFYILDVIKTPEKKTLTLLVIRNEGKQPYVCNMQYEEQSWYFDTVDKMLDHCISEKWISKWKAKKLKRYYSKRKENMNV